MCVAVQTPNKFLKSLVASKMEKSTSKPNKDHDAQIAAQARKDAEKEFKQIAEKVNCEAFLFQHIRYTFLIRNYQLKSNFDFPWKLQTR